MVEKNKLLVMHVLKSAVNVVDISTFTSNLASFKSILRLFVQNILYFAAMNTVGHCRRVLLLNQSAMTVPRNGRSGLALVKYGKVSAIDFKYVKNGKQQLMGYFLSKPCSPVTFSHNFISLET